MTSTASTYRPAWLTPDREADLLRWVVRAPDGDGPALTPVAPYDLQPTVTLPTSTADDVENAVGRGRAVQPGWHQTPVRQRANVMLAFHDLLVDRQDEVLDLIQWETGKGRLHAWQEIAQVATIARHYGRKAKAYLADNPVRGMVPVLTKVKEVRVPKGVVGIISPWNYPLYLGVGDVIPALLAGNAVVSKADSQTPLTLLWTRALLAEAGLPADLWQVVAGAGSVVGNALIEGVDYICFTGSTATGRRVGEQAGRRLIGASLELGGKNPLIVREDADITKAAAGTVMAAFANTGQMCIAIERVYVHDAVYDAFRDAVVAATQAQSIGQAYDFSVDLGSLTSQAQLDAVSAHVEDARSKGATVLAGGRARPDLGPLCYEPTVLEGVTEEMEVCDEETFGPVIALYRFGSDAEAVALANRGSYGLSASIWSKDTGRAESLAQRIRAGAVSINDGAAAAAGSVEAGMGGMGDSGLGRRHGAEGIRKYTESQTIATQRLIALGVPERKTAEQFVTLTNQQLKLFKKLGLR
ncbi:succinic semialdehyde dehydrogenase [Nocardioides phosphati]|nr:succinic semialdehyde dehydrogenase [Nocardioides phosphati]